MLVEHSYGGKVITEMGDLPNVKSLVYIAAFAPDAVESAGALSHAMPPAGIDSITPDSDGYLWVAQDKYHANFCQDLSKEEADIMAVPKSPHRQHLWRYRNRTCVESQAQLLSSLYPRPYDSP